MKNNRIIFLTIAIFLYTICITSCSGNRERMLMQKAESVIDEHPDSAFAILDSMKAASNEFSTADRMKFNVLLAYSMTKCDIPIDTMMTIKNAVEYYDTWGNNHERMIANYMMGSVFRDRGDAPMALQYFREAINAADTTKSDCDFKMLSRIYGQMAGLFNELRSPEMELEMEHKAIHYAYIAKDTVNAVIFYSHTADAYHLLGKKDSVIQIFKEASKKYIKHGYRNYAASLQSVFMDYYIGDRDYHNAKKAMEEYEQFSGFFDKDGNIEQGREIYYSRKGEYYLGTGKTDSAKYFYRKLLNYPSDILNLENGYKGLMMVYQKLNKPDSIAKYASLFAEANDSACVLSSSEETNRMQAIYNYNENKRIADLKSTEADRYRNIIYVIVIISAITVYYIYRYIKRQQIQKRQEMQVINKQYSDALSRYDELQQINCSIEHNFEQYKINNNKEIERLKMLLITYQEDDIQPERWNIEQAILSSPIIKHLHKLAQKGQAPSDNDWKALHYFTNNSFPDLSDNINNENICLTDKEKRVCVLTKLRFIPTEIAVMLNTTKQNITNIRGSINRKLFNANGTKSFDFNIRNM